MKIKQFSDKKRDSVYIFDPNLTKEKSNKLKIE